MATGRSGRRDKDLETRAEMFFAERLCAPAWIQAEDDEDDDFIIGTVLEENMVVEIVFFFYRTNLQRD
jgi:hypothetical protein